MSNIVIDSFPKFGKKLNEEIRCCCNLEYAYFADDKRLELSEEQRTSKTITYKVGDKDGKWHPKDYGLNLKFRINIEDTTELFGDHGIAYSKGDRIGIAILWKDNEASVQGCLPVTDFSSEEHSVAVSYIAKLPSATLRGKLLVEIVFYLKAVKYKETERPYARQVGTVLGTLFQFEFIIEGNGSVFPVMEISGEPSEPLWWVEWNCEDPDVDMFNSDHFCIMLNRNNAAYQYLHADGQDNPVLLVEILSSALQILIANVSNFNFDPNANYTPGSIHHMVDYLMKTFGFSYNPDESQNLAKTIRTELMSLMLGDGK